MGAGPRGSSSVAAGSRRACARTLVTAVGLVASRGRPRIMGIRNVGGGCAIVSPCCCLDVDAD